jgi:hypothetical protein
MKREDDRQDEQQGEGGRDEPNGDRDPIPRRSLLSAMPKRTFFRVVVLLAALGGIVYLRERTGSIASCMSSSFPIVPPAPESVETAVRARIEVRLDSSERPSP